MQILICTATVDDKFEEGEQMFMESMSPVGSAFATNKRGEHLTFFPQDTANKFYCASTGGSQNDPKYLFDLIEA